jgi:hypothetical protein
MKQQTKPNKQKKSYDKSKSKANSGRQYLHHQFEDPPVRAAQSLTRSEMVIPERGIKNLYKQTERNH